MINIALDGPSGGGKSTLAKMIAKELGYIHVDTGALYRSIALYVLKRGINPQDAEAVSAVLADIQLDVKYENGKQQICLNGEYVGDAIRTPEVSSATSIVSSIPAVRSFLLATQKNIAAERNVVMDGRDIGTVILPDAQVKIFLSASKETRAKRRYLELVSKGVQTSYEDILAAMIERDSNDEHRQTAPAIAASDAILLDNSELDLNGTLQAALAIIRSKLK